jgi:hypothetical protein
MTKKQEEEINLIIQNMQILLSNMLPVSESEAVLQAYNEARFILEIELLRIFQASLPSVTKRAMTDASVIRESLIYAVANEVAYSRNHFNLSALRLENAEKIKNRLLDFSFPVSKETDNQSLKGDL